MSVVRTVSRGPLVLARGVGAGARGAWRGGRWVVRGFAGPHDPSARARRRAIMTASSWGAAVAFAFIALGTAASVYDIARIGLGVTPFIAALAGLPLGLVTWRPMTGWAVSLVSAYVFASVLPVRDGDPWPWLVAHGLVLLALLFALCARETLGRAVWAWLLTCLLFAWGVPSDLRAGWMVAVTSVAVMGVLAGRLVRTRRALAQQEQLSSTEKARRVVLEERARIARDLHDIVAHHMSLVVVQAETAPYRVPDLSDGARRELTSISESARSALAETRALLNVLRQEHDAVERAPQPDLEQLPELMDAARNAGVLVTSHVRGAVADLRPGTSLAAYRIVQEALANAARHAPGTRVKVEVSRGEHALWVTVVNGPLRPRPGDAETVAAPDGAVVEGHGITGMRERAVAEGGTLAAGPTADGGFAVRVDLPLGSATPALDPGAGPGAASPQRPTTGAPS